MDNITQGILGGSIYTAITKKASNKGFRLMAVVTNIPDFDIFIARLVHSNPIDQQFFHRGITHSIIFNVGLSLIIGYCLYRSDKTIPYRRYALGCFASILFGHLFIDGMTSYGMRYFLPWDKTVHSRDNMFVVDFGMRLITISGFVRYLVSKAKNKVALWILGIAGSYIAASVAIQSYTDSIFKSHYPAASSGEIVQQSITSVEPLQIILRRHVIKTDKHFYEGYYSVLDKDKNIQRQTYDIDTQAKQYIDQLAQQPTTLGKHLQLALNRSRGLYRIVPSEQGYQIQSFAMGGLNGRTGGSQRMFGFTVVGEPGQEELTGTRSGGRASRLDANTRNMFWTRVFGQK
ncbi:MAG: metal-dependent hydrolase [Candidatus Absconditabacterales bacterium]